MDIFKNYNTVNIEYILSCSFYTDKYMYVFSQLVEGTNLVLLHKEFLNEDEFKRDINDLVRIFNCEVISDSYDLSRLSLMQIPSPAP